MNLGNFLDVMDAQLSNLMKCDNTMVNYHRIAVRCNYNDSRKSNKLTKYPHMVDENGNIVRFFVLPSGSKQSVD